MPRPASTMSAGEAVEIPNTQDEIILAFGIPFNTLLVSFLLQP